MKKSFINRITDEITTCTTTTELLKYESCVLNSSAWKKWSKEERAFFDEESNKWFSKLIRK